MKPIPLAQFDRSEQVPAFLNDTQWTALISALHLSPREADVLRCIMIDDRVASVAKELGLSQGTIHTYRERLFRKIGVRSCAQLVGAAFAMHARLEREVSQNKS